MTSLSPTPAHLNTTCRDISCFAYWKNDNQLLMDPPYQRGDVWNNPRKIDLIRSLLLGIPIGAIVMNNRFACDEFPKPSNDTTTDDWKYTIIDGKQRLTAIFLFLESRLVIPAEWVKPTYRIAKKADFVTFGTLTRPGQRSFEHIGLTCCEARLPSVKSEKFVFDLINFGGVAQGSVDPQ